MLGQFERAVLDFEREWWKLPGPKDEMISSELGCTADEFYCHLLALLDDPLARAYDPLTVHRLRRLCDSGPSIEDRLPEA